MNRRNRYKAGDNIIYIYTHHFNSRASALRVKKGKFVRYVKTRKGISKRKCVVKLEGNKGNSIVSLNSIFSDE